VSRTLALLLAVVAVAALTIAGNAVAATPKTTLGTVEKQLMCDTCRVPLNIANSARADQERAEIQQLIGRGLTKQQILDRFAAKYGNDILALPKGGGSSITVWAIPAAVVLAVALGLLLAIPRWRRRPPSDGPGTRDTPDLSSDDAQRLDREIAAYDL
jgi:cytochrome c-type biogenesis protein CcmH/NrfF